MAPSLDPDATGNGFEATGNGMDQGPDDGPDDRYVLGTHHDERERLRLQHWLWLPAARRSWERAGVGAGDRVLDLGAGPGDVSLELARLVGPEGRVLALERSGAYVEEARAAALAAGLGQVEVRRHDLATDPLPREGFDFAWCRWVAMFLPRLEPLVEQLAAALRPGGRLVAHEYVLWESFALHPHGKAVARFGAATTASFREAGGTTDPNRRLPALLGAAGFRVEALRPLPVLGRGGDAWSQWLERFVVVYGEELLRRGLWSQAEARAAAAEMAAARKDPGSFWVGPTVLELQARRLSPA